MSLAPGIKQICVVGAGLMGHQIAIGAALAGYKVSCVDTSPQALQNAQGFLAKYLARQTNKGKLSAKVAKLTEQNLIWGTDLEVAATDADLVIEVVPEILAVKRDLFARLDRICPRHTILATNSSFIVSSRIADATERPEKICNMHFFTPPLTALPVEIVQGPHTAKLTVQTVAQVVVSMGKIPIHIDKEIHGFLVNRILAAVQREALFLYDTGVASFEDIDTAVKQGLGHMKAPFEIMDIIGLDLVLQINMEHYRETGNPAFKPSPSVVEKVVKKQLGRKTGRGFYDYSQMIKARGF